MKSALNSRFFALKIRTVRWMAVHLPAVGLGLEALRADLPTIADYIPAGLYKGSMVACVVALVLRFTTSKPLSAYKTDGTGE